MWMIEISSNGKDWVRWPTSTKEYSEKDATNIANNINETISKNTIDIDKFDPSAYSARAREAPLTQPSPQQPKEIILKDQSVLAKRRRGEL
jgi:hypothetical protein